MVIRTRRRFQQTVEHIISNMPRELSVVLQRADMDTSSVKKFHSCMFVER